MGDKKMFRSQLILILLSSIFLSYRLSDFSSSETASDHSLTEQ